MKRLLLFSLALLCLDVNLRAGQDNDADKEAARRQYFNTRLDHAHKEALEMLGDISRQQEKAQEYFDDLDDLEDLRNEIMPMAKETTPLIEALDVAIPTVKKMASENDVLSIQLLKDVRKNLEETDTCRPETLTEFVLASNPIFSTKLKEICKKYHEGKPDAEELGSDFAEYTKRNASAYLNVYKKLLCE